MTITPSAAVTAGAHWRLDGGAATHSGATVTNISVGVHTVSFTPVLGWTTPSNQMVTIASGPTKKATGVYTPEPKGNPNLIISSPKSAESVSNALLLITGTVSDKVAVYVVQYQLNGGGWTLATTSNSWSDWSASVALNSGANRISAYAEDTSGSFSSTNTVAFKFIPSATLALQINGNGTVTPNLNRKLLPIAANYTLKASQVATMSSPIGLAAQRYLTPYSAPTLPTHLSWSLTWCCKLISSPIHSSWNRELSTASFWTPTT